MKCLATWHFIEQQLEEGNPVMLVYVLDSQGTTPGKQGYCMAVAYEGSASPLAMEGTIGGGMIEHDCVEEARKKLQSGDITPEIKKLPPHNGSIANRKTNLSGEQTILFYTVQEKDRSVISTIIQSLQDNQNGTLILTPSGISFRQTNPANDFEFLMNSETQWKYIEKTGFKNRLFIIGGGHCSLALSKLMKGMDFYIRIYDDRSQLKSMLINDAAHEKHVVSGYEEIANLIVSGDDHYVVIMTMSAEKDEIALRALDGKKFRYIGMLGSRTKVRDLMKEYKREGLNYEWLSQVHAPIGLSIKSHSPEEIAVSIAAEIIQVKNAFHATTIPASDHIHI